MTEENEAVKEIAQTLTTKEDLKLRSDFFKGMSKFRGQVVAPKKNGHVDFTGKKGRTKYDYVLLDDLIDAIDKALKGTQLSWRQETTNSDGGVSVRTIIDCDTGFEYKSPWLALRTSGMPQDVGSAMTYAKRYSLGTTFGVSSEADDDGQEAQKDAENKPATQHKAFAKRPAKPQTNQVNDPNVKAKQDLKVRLKAISTEMKVAEKKLLVKAAGKAKVNDLSHMTKNDLSALDHELTTELMEFRQSQQKDDKVTEAGDDFLDHLDVDA